MLIRCGGGLPGFVPTPQRGPTMAFGAAGRDERVRAFRTRNRIAVSHLRFPRYGDLCCMAVAETDN